MNTIIFIFLLLINTSIPLFAMKKSNSENQVTQNLARKIARQKEIRENYLLCLEELMAHTYHNPEFDQNMVMNKLTKLLNEIAQKEIILTEIEMSKIQCGPQKQSLLHVIIDGDNLDCCEALFRHQVSKEAVMELLKKKYRD
ncbi:MAG: hypothetical protein Q8Q25_02615 [bacterium]|nr:hypothetical protein [bacterium]